MLVYGLSITLTTLIMPGVGRQARAGWAGGLARQCKARQDTSLYRHAPHPHRQAAARDILGTARYGTRTMGATGARTP